MAATCGPPCYVRSSVAEAMAATSAGMTVAVELETKNAQSVSRSHELRKRLYPALASTRIVTMSVSWYCWW